MKKCSIWANAMLAYAYFFYIFLLCAGTVFVWHCDLVGGIVVMACTVATVVIACLCAERWGVILTFTETGILYKPFLRNETLLEYRNLPRIQYAYYMHGNIFAAYKVHFFVLTNRRLSHEELSHINEVAPSKDLMKIRYTHRNYQKLLDALPASIAVSIKAIYSTYIA